MNATPPSSPRSRRWWGWGAGAVGILVVLTVSSIFVGVTEIGPLDVLAGRASDQQWENLVISRVPRTVAVLLAGAALAVSGLLMQALVRNRFVEPGTVGTSESAVVGILLVTLLWPGAPLTVKMLVAIVTALLGTALFLKLVRAIPRGEAIVAVPLIGMMLAGMISAATTFVAYRYDLLATLGTWMAGDFSGVLRGRYELLWLVGAVFVAIWVAADRFTIASLGEAHASSLGLRYQSAVTLGLALICAGSAICLVVVGAIPFIGLVVPNLITRLLGDNLRRCLPWIAASGAGFVLVCDLLARTVNRPFEVPVGTIAGVLGAATFLILLARQAPRLAGGTR